MTRLTHWLGSERMLRATVILPTDQFFPERYQQSDADAARIFALVCKHMQVKRSRVVLEMQDRISDEDPLGLYVPGNPARILIRRSELADPESLVATIAHELAHEILIGGGFVQDNNEDLERLTDLVTVFTGLGIFAANSTLREKTIREGRFSWWSLRKQGYLPVRMYGYGLALFAWSREEKCPSWCKHLRLDAREPLQGGLRYLRKTGDSTFRVETAANPAELEPLDHALEKLRNPSASFRYLGLIQLIGMGATAAPAAALASTLLRDRDPEVSAAAAHLLGVIGAQAAKYATELHDLLWSRQPANRENAAFALGEIRPADAAIIKDIARLLDDGDAGIARAAAEALGKYGPAVDGAGPALLGKYQQALIKCDYSSIDAIATAINHIFPNARHVVEEHFAPVDRELCDFAVQCLLDTQEPTSSGQ